MGFAIYGFPARLEDLLWSRGYYISYSQCDPNPGKETERVIAKSMARGMDPATRMIGT